MPLRNCAVVDCEQRTPEWFAARLGVLTASNAADMLAKPLKSGGEPASKRDLRVRLALERLTGQPCEDNGYVSADMRRGVELEPEAFAAFEAATGEVVQRVGFIRHDALPIGCSPDGIIGDFDGGLELKVPRSATHLSYLRRPGVLPAEYQGQILHSLFVTGLSHWHFASYDPRFPEPMRLFLVRVARNEVDLKAYELTLTMFLREVEQELDAMRGLMAAGVA